MIEAPEIINLQLCDLEQLLLKYYTEKLNIENLKIESKIVDKVVGLGREIEFKLISRKEINQNMNINREYTLEKKDIDIAINDYLAIENYKVYKLNYNFKEFVDEVKNIQLFVTKRKQNILKKILTKKKI